MQTQNLIKHNNKNTMTKKVCTMMKKTKAPKDSSSTTGKRTVRATGARFKIREMVKNA